MSEGSSNQPITLWFAVFCKPRREMEGVEQLERQGFTTFLPRVRSRRRLRGQWQDIVEPMFPRYLFLRATPGHDDLRPVRSTRGVIGLVRFGGEPKPVPETVMAELHRLCGEQDGVLALPPPLVPGSSVRILEGPFAGCEGELLSQDGKRRALVLLELLGRSNAIQLPLDVLAPAN
ncbi:MAG TPA: transcription termination/antitermination NusG family protein [Candidatus Competibacter sp.]|nr:transcription termination/antitermination NusG family protein [Candidatus Competibacter sp.]